MNYAIRIVRNHCPYIGYSKTLRGWERWFGDPTLYADLNQAHIQRNSLQHSAILDDNETIQYYVEEHP